MNELSYSLILLAGAMFAGMIGALTGLGGGIVIVPLLTMGLGLPMKYALAASLISVIGTSSGAASAYVKEGITNIRIGMFLEIATTIGAVLGALLVILVDIPVDWIGGIFGLVLLFNAILTVRKKPDHFLPLIKGSTAEKLRLYGTVPNNEVPYSTTNTVAGFCMMSLAGFLSGLLGIGGGAFKVLAMDNIMKLPFKVSTTTSNFMIGVTAVASSLIYLLNGYVIPHIAAPILIGVIFGSMIGSRLLLKLNVVILKKIFAVVVTALAIYMIYNGVTGNFSARQA